jgi:hypothetical protein
LSAASFRSFCTAAEFPTGQLEPVDSAGKSPDGDGAIWRSVWEGGRKTGRATEKSGLTGAIGPASGKLATLIGPSPASCMTGPSGSFLFQGLAPGDYTLLVGISTFQRMTIQANGEVNLGDLAP